MRFFSVILISLSFGSFISSDFNRARADSRWDDTPPTINYPQLNSAEQSELEAVINFGRGEDVGPYQNDSPSGWIRGLVDSYRLSLTEGRPRKWWQRNESLNDIEEKVELALARARALALEEAIDALNLGWREEGGLDPQDLQLLKKTPEYFRKLAAIALVLYQDLNRKIDRTLVNQQIRTRLDKEVELGLRDDQSALKAYSLERKVDVTSDLFFKTWVIQELAWEANTGFDKLQKEGASRDKDLLLKRRLSPLLEMREIYRNGLEMTGF